MITEKEYPQMGVGLSGEARGGALHGPAAYKQGENVPFYRPEAVTGWQCEGQALELTLSCAPWINRTVYTHETHMHQFARTEGAPRTMTMRLEFWSDFVFRVRFTDGEGLRLPGAYPPPESRMLCGQPEQVTVTLHEREDALVFESPEVSLTLTKKRPALSARDRSGRLFFAQSRTDLFTADVFEVSCAHLEGGDACFDSFALTPGEAVYGLGERFDHLDRRGKVVDFWNKDAIGTSSRRTYINVPFLMTTRGWGLFLNSSRPTEWEVGTLDASTLGVGVEDGELDYFVILGPDPSAILKRYTRLTGAPELPPVWSFGLWMSRNSYLSWTVVEEVAQGLRARGIPADVLHLDTAWFREDWNCDLRFSEERFPDPEAHMSALRALGFYVSLWQYNFVPPRENNQNFLEGREKGYFVKDEAGQPIPCAPGHAGSWTDDRVIDFTNPEAAAWYAKQIEGLIRMGAAAIKTDFGEGVPPEGRYANLDSREAHNLYSLIYNSVVHQAVKRANPETVLWARSGTAGSQRYPVHWGGDSQCSWAGLEGTLRAALSLGLSGIPFFSHDVGGFIGRPDPELYIRWAQFGFFSSHTRCHGAGNENSREPWSFGAEAERIFLKFDHLRYALLPYLYGEAKKCVETAKPMVRALVIEHPEDRNVWGIDDEYYFGDQLLAAPVLAPLSQSSTRAVYLPQGVWYDFWTHERLDSRGEWFERALDLDTMPLFVKAGSCLPYAAERQATENQVGRAVRLEVFGLQEGVWQLDTGEQRLRVEAGPEGLRVSGCEDAEIAVIQ